MTRLNRRQLSAIVRVLVGIGLFLVMLAFLRACLSPPQLPPPKTGVQAEQQDALNHGTLPPAY